MAGFDLSAVIDTAISGVGGRAQGRQEREEREAERRRTAFEQSLAKRRDLRAQRRLQHEEEEIENQRVSDTAGVEFGLSELRQFDAEEADRIADSGLPPEALNRAIQDALSRHRTVAQAGELQDVREPSEEDEVRDAINKRVSELMRDFSSEELTPVKMAELRRDAEQQVRQSRRPSEEQFETLLEQAISDPFSVLDESDAQSAHETIQEILDGNQTLSSNRPSDMSDPVRRAMFEAIRQGVQGPLREQVAANRERTRRGVHAAEPPPARPDTLDPLRAAIGLP